MAYINIKDAVIDRVFYDGKGLAVHEEFDKNDGTKGKSYFTVWLDEDEGFEVGDTISGGGRHSAKVSSYDAQVDGETVKRHSADVSINGFKVKEDSL